MTDVEDGDGESSRLLGPETPKSKHKWTHVYLWLAVGQLLSLCITGSSVATQYLSDWDVHLPTTQSLLLYVALMLIFGPVFLYRMCYVKSSIQNMENGGKILPESDVAGKMNVRWYWYLAIALIDLEANAVVVKAYQFTGIASVVLLDCFVIPCVMVYSKVIPALSKFSSYRIYPHIIGVFVCISGVILVFLGDIVSGNGDAGHGQLSWLGDCLVLVSAFLYGTSNVGQEVIVKQFDIVEYLAMIGTFGSVLAGVQTMILEYEGLCGVVWDWYIVLTLLMFTLCLTVMYCAAPFLLRNAGATVMNLSLLTSDVFGLVASIALFNYRPSYLYIVAFVCVVLGLILYSSKKTAKEQH